MVADPWTDPSLDRGVSLRAASSALAVPVATSAANPITATNFFPICVM
jgi:hypothetical protein